MNVVRDEWIPVLDAPARVDLYERDGVRIVGMELAKSTPTEKVLLPAFAVFSSCGEAESWTFARDLLREHLPAAATHVTFTT